MRQAIRTSIAGISWKRLQRESSETYPCHSECDPGAMIVFMDRFDTYNGRMQLVPVDIIPANELPDADYPFVLITERQLEHRHAGSMTRRASVSDTIKPITTASMHGDDLLELDLQSGDVIIGAVTPRSDGHSSALGF